MVRTEDVLFVAGPPGNRVRGYRASASPFRFDHRMPRQHMAANEGEYPLLGVGLLFGHDLHISYRSGNLTIE